MIADRLEGVKLCKHRFACVMLLSELRFAWPSKHRAMDVWLKQRFFAPKRAFRRSTNPLRPSEEFDSSNWMRQGVGTRYTGILFQLPIPTARTECSVVYKAGVTSFYVREKMSISHTAIEPPECSNAAGVRLISFPSNYFPISSCSDDMVFSAWSGLAIAYISGTGIFS